MSNIGGLEIIVVLLVALIVLGPTKLPDAARQIGKAVTELRRISGGFQRELREAIHDPIVEAEARARGAVESTKKNIVEPFKNSPPPRTASDTTPVVESAADDGSPDDSPDPAADTSVEND